MNLIRFWVLLAGGIILDQATKFLAQHFLSFFSSVTIIPSVLYFQLVHNFGAAYGIFQYQRGMLVVVGIVITAFLFFYFFKYAQSVWLKYGIIFVLIGACGNLIDRITLGYVVDFIDIRLFPVFNLADVSIDVGLVLVLWDSFVVKKSVQ